MSTQPEEKFNVFQFFKDDSQEQVRQFVSAEEAVKAAQHYTTCVTARLGITARVIITDMMDNCCFEWKYGEGVVFPPKEPTTKFTDCED